MTVHEERVANRALDPQPAPPSVYLPEKRSYRLKNRFLGKPLHTEELAHERLGKPTALAVFASDNLSSSAYASEEILRVLVPIVGVAAFSLLVPITVAILVVLGLLILSYRQTIKAYPSAGGAYIVTRDNFGLLPAQVAGVALLTDYILTVAVSVAAGTAALTSVAPGLAPYAVLVSVGFIVLIAYGNLRGVRESGKLFGVPTYLFILNMAVLIGLGVMRMKFGHLPVLREYPDGAQKFGTKGGGLLLGASAWVVMRSFASGGAAVTGVEAISNGVPAFRVPEWKNARETLVVMGALLGAMFLGLSVLAAHMHIAPFEVGTPTVISQVGKLVYGPSALGKSMYYFLQASTMMILVLAANTSFADFPRLASFHAGDNFMPRQLTKRGHRLVFSNGILALAATSILLVVATDAKVDRLIPLYAIGVFTSFTLSQAGMARHHVRLKEDGWRMGLLINGAGSVVSLLVTVVIAATKFRSGAWVIILFVPIMVALLVRLNKQYESEAEELAGGAPGAAEAPILRRHVVMVFIDSLDVAAARAIQYARTLMPDELRAVHIDLDPIRSEDLVIAWRALGLTRLTLDVVECPDRRIERAAAEQVAGELGDKGTEVTVLIPRREYTRSWHRLLHDHTGSAISRALSTLPHCNVTIVPYHLGDAHEDGARLLSAASTDAGAPDEGAVAAPERTRRGHRDRVTISGRVRAMRVQPRAGVATLECTVVDETGPMTVVFLGRRDMPGLYVGRQVLAEGIVGEHHGRPAMLNPRFELLEDPNAHEQPPSGH